MGRKWRKSSQPPKRLKSEWTEAANLSDAENLVREVWQHAIFDKPWHHNKHKFKWYSGSTKYDSLLIAEWDQDKGKLWIRHRLGREM